MTALNYEDFQRINEAIIAAQSKVGLEQPISSLLQEAKDNLMNALSYSTKLEEDLLNQTFE